MKVKLLALCALLSVADANAQQKYILPIGSNVNSRPMTVNIGLGNRDTGWFITDRLDYTPAMGDFEKVVQYRVSVLAGKFSPPTGSGSDQYVLQIIAEPGPYTVVRFQLDQFGNIPPEVLYVKLQYGVDGSWKLQGVTDMKMRLFKNGESVRYYSTKEGVGPDSPCEVGAAKSSLAVGWITINGIYSYPWLKENWWDYGEISIEAYDGWATFYNANGSPRDGEMIAVSEPPPAFLESLRAPEMPAPRIASIKRSGNTTEITVSAANNTSAHLEFSETLNGNGNWYSIPKYLQPLSIQTGSTTFTHTTDAPASFYRLRISSSSPQ